MYLKRRDLETSMFLGHFSEQTSEFSLKSYVGTATFIRYLYFTFHGKSTSGDCFGNAFNPIAWAFVQPLIRTFKRTLEIPAQK